MKNGETVAAFERAFAEYVGARYAIALCNGTATLHTALVALGVKPGDKVAVPPLTMSATTIAVLHAGATPVFVDVDPQTWLMGSPWEERASIPVSLYGLCDPQGGNGFVDRRVDDAAQTLRQHSGCAFTSYSFQASKILPLGEGGMLVTDSEELATKAREFSSLGYRMRADQPRIDPAVLKHPTYERHHSLGWNYRMNDYTASLGMAFLTGRGQVRTGLLFTDVQSERTVEHLKAERQQCAALYRDAIRGCSWLTPQHIPEGWTNDFWAFAVALESADLFDPFVKAIVHHGGERPYGAWRLTYQEPALRHLVGPTQVVQGERTHRIERVGLCPVAESLQPRLVQFQTNDLRSAERNAEAVMRAIAEMNG